LEETDEEVFKNTVQSMNERDNVNYLIESSNDNNNKFQREIISNQKYFNSTLNIGNEYNNINYNNVNNSNIQSSRDSNTNKKILLNSNNIITSNNNNNIMNCNISPIVNFKDMTLKDRDEVYIKSTEKLLGSLKASIDFFNEIPNDFSSKNSDLKDRAVKMLKDELDKIKSEKEIILSENKKLKEKIKIFMKNNSSNNLNAINTNNSLSKSNQNMSNSLSYIDDNSVPVNKVIESLLKLQLKYDELEKENIYLKSENEDLNRKLTVTNKFVTEGKERDKYSPYNKTRPGTKSQTYNPINSKRKQSYEMENLIKEQLKCMQKMLYLVQEDNSNNEVK